MRKANGQSSTSSVTSKKGRLAAPETDGDSIQRTSKSNLSTASGEMRKPNGQSPTSSITSKNCRFAAPETDGDSIQRTSKSNLSTASGEMRKANGQSSNASVASKSCRFAAPETDGDTVGKPNLKPVRGRHTRKANKRSRKIRLVTFMFCRKSFGHVYCYLLFYVALTYEDQFPFIII